MKALKDNHNQKKKIRTINPSTEKANEEYPIVEKEDIENRVKKARNSFVEWKKDYDSRANFLYAFAEGFDKESESLARIATNEMGKAIKESRSEVTKCSWAIKYFADSGKNFLLDEVINTDARKSFVSFEPLGVVASLMPWNFPYWQALRFAAPSLMAGNTVILKLSSNTMQCGIEIEKLFEQIGLPTGVFQTIIATYEEAEALIDSGGVKCCHIYWQYPCWGQSCTKSNIPNKENRSGAGGK